MKLLFLIIFFTLVAQCFVFGQSKEKHTSQVINPASFQSDTLVSLILQSLNKQLTFNNHEELQIHKILKLAAEDHAEYMAMVEEALPEQNNKKKRTLEDRMNYYGGSANAQELIQKEVLKKGEQMLTYKELAYNIAFKWINTKKHLDILLNPSVIFAGLGARVDAKGKKVYVSLVLGNYYSLNSGANRRNELDAPYSTRLFGLNPYDDKTCRKCNDFRNMVDLQQGLVIRDGIIYFKYNRFKELTRLLKDPKDGIIVDLVQKDQYPCIGDNILDNNLLTKGIVIKKMWGDEIVKENLILDKKRDEFEVKIGKVPENVKGDFDLNLLIIKDQRVCKTIVRSYTIEAGLEYKNKVELLADTLTIGGAKRFEPSANTSTITFKIPFAKGKIDYKTDDIEPLLRQLDEPDYIVNDVKVTSYSSIEGSAEVNAQLQKDRANSIIKVMKELQKKNISASVKTKDNWELFREDIKSSKYPELADKTNAEILNFIKEKKLYEELEPILAKGRYAEVEMTVTYDISGSKEEPYTVYMFNKAVRNKDLPTALSIQKYIFKKVHRNKYSAKAVSDMKIPEEKEMAGLLMNKLWLEQYVSKNDLNEETLEKIKGLHQLNSTNPYIHYNLIYSAINIGKLGTEKEISERQKQIEELYSTTLSKTTVDNLNIEYQFKIMHQYDSLATPHPKMLSSLEKVKKIVNVNDGNWQSSLKLAYIFIGQKDYEFAIKLIEPFIDEQNVFDELLFTYIALCSKVQEKQQSSLFLMAMKKAYNSDSQRFCKTISKDQMSFQVFDNTDVKEFYCKSCSGQ